MIQPFTDAANGIQIKVSAAVGDGFAVTVMRGVSGTHPDLYIVPWLTPPMNIYETVDIWLDSSCNGYESDVGPGGLRYGRRGDGTVIGNGDDPCANQRRTSTAGARQAHNFHVGGDRDWVKFNATAGVNYVIETFTTSDTYLELYGSDGSTLIAADDDTGEGPAAKIVWWASTGGVYYVRVKHYSGSAYGPATAYELSVTGGQECYDLAPDGQVNVYDVQLIASRWRATGADYDERFDLDRDGMIRVNDILLVASQFGQICP